jgi:hypothetical protein
MENARTLGPAYADRVLNGGTHHRKAEDRKKMTTFCRIAAGLETPSAADGLR